MQFPNTLLQNFFKSYSSLDSSGLLNNISRLCLSFTPTPQHCIILTDIGSPNYPVRLLSATLWAPSTFEEVLPSEYLFHFGNNYNTCMGYCSFHCLWKFYMCIFSSYCTWNHVITYMYINSYVSIKLWKSSRSGF